MNRRLATAAAALIGLIGMGLAGVAPTAAGASPPRPARSFAAPASVHRVVQHFDQNALALAQGVKPAARAPASVQPVSQLFPACYGDSRDISFPTGTLRPASFGAFYSCSQHQWTFEVQTADTWARTSLGDWFVTIDTDGIGNDNCGGFEYQAFVAQTATAGQFVGGVQSITGDPSGQNCTTGALVPGTITITANTVAISFPQGAIQNSPSLLWLGQLQNRTEEVNGLSGDEVPDPSFADGACCGVIADSVQGPSPSATACAAAGTAGAQSAATSDSGRAAAALRRAGFRNVHDYGKGVVAFSGDATTAQSALTAAGISAHISHSEPFKPDAGTNNAPDDTDFGSQWNLGAINAAGAWSVTTGNHIVVADIDTGVDFGQTDLSSPQLVPGIDESGTTPVSLDYSSGPADPDGHGTAVAGVIAAATDNSNLLASLGWNTSVMPVKVDFTNPQVDSQIAAGIDWAADNTANPVKVINLSLGGPCPDPVIQAAVQHAQGKGILVVAAAGNMALSEGLDPTPSDLSYNDPPSYPAAYSGVLAVGATGRDGYRAAYANTGSDVSLVAPGGSADGNAADDIPLLQTQANGGGTFTEAGTSFAAPQVSATAALIWSVNPNLTASQVAEIIRSSATPLGVAGTDGLNGTLNGNNNTDIAYGTGLLNAGAALADTPSPDPKYGTFYSLAPARILDTRLNVGHAGKVTGGQTINLTVTGQGGIPATGATAVVLNVTVANPTTSGYVTVWPAGQSRPNSSSINYNVGQTLPNLVTVKVGASGQVSLFNNSGSADLVADVAGYYGDGTAAVGSTFMPVAPHRLLDTRTTAGPIRGPIQGGTLNNNLPIAMDGGVVPSGATAVVLNVTATGPTTGSYLTVYPEGATKPTASNLNFAPGQTVPNLVVVQLGANGGVSFFTATGSVQVVVDVEGYFTATGDTSGSRFFPLVNHRILDTRTNLGGYSTPIPGGQSDPVAIVGQGGVIDCASAVIMNTTVTAPTVGSYLTVYPDGQTRPNASNLNFAAGATVANLVSATVGTGGTWDQGGAVDIFNDTGTVQTLADVAGWYTGSTCSISSAS